MKLAHALWIVSAFLMVACTPQNQTDQTSPELQSTTAPDPLPSWKDGPVKQRILNFVERITDSSGANYVAPIDRIATFDNDGTLWCEQPLYFPFFYVVDRVQAQASEHSEWQDVSPFKEVISGDYSAMMKHGVPGIVALMEASAPTMDVEAYDQSVREWLDTARHPTTDKKYTDMVYQPMLELLDFLRANGFKTFIVSGGGLEFMRPWMNEVYGIPTDQVVGSYNELEWSEQNGEPVILRKPKMENFNDRGNKPLNIRKFIGKRPIAAFGNSDGDLAMLRYTAAGAGERLKVYIHHTDSIREWAYDRGSHIGGLDKGLDTALARSWTVVDMAQDWKVVFPE